MARLPALVDALTGVDGRDRGVMDHMAREIREVGLIQTTKRGRGSAEMTSQDAAHLLLGVYGSDGRGSAAEAARILGPLRVLRLPGLSEPAGGRWHPGAEAIQNQLTLAGAVAAVIELGKQLADQSIRTQSTLPVLGPMFEQPKDGLELEGWPDGLSVMLRIHRPTLEAYLVLAWRGARRVEEHTVLFAPGRAQADGVRPISAFEVHTLVHARVFRALHRVLYAEV